MRDAAMRVAWSPDRGERSSFYVGKMELFLRTGDQSRAKAYADSAVAVGTEKIREIPNEAVFHMELAGALAVLGRKPQALAAMQKAVTLQPLSKDQFLGTTLYVTRAITLMRLGETALSRNYLRLDPLFTPLRSNARFPRLIQGS